MKKILLASVALFGATVGAMAADLPRRQAAPVYAPVPVFTWTGFYVGVNAGYGFGDNNNDAIFLPGGSVINSAGTNGTLTFNNNDDRDGFVGGGQIGFNYQTGMFVFGIEADLQYADLNNDNNRNGTFTFTGVPGAAFAGNPLVVHNRNGIEWFGTVRGRAGVAFDRTLVYATGGFAFGGGGDNNNNFAGFGFNNDDDTRGGWTVGGGVEYAFTNNFTVKVEGLYVNLDRGNNNNFGNGAAFDPVTNTVFVGNSNKEDDFFVVRAGLNYKF